MMCNKMLLSLFYFLIFVSISHGIDAQTSWEITMIKDDVKVYTKLEEDSDFKSFKAVVVVNASIETIIAVLKNANRYTEWYGYTKAAEILKQEQEVQYNYVETMFPWPYSNRDMVYRMSVTRVDSALVKVSLTGLPDYTPERKGVVRMKEAGGYILLKGIDTTITEVIYVFHSEPGDVPVWLANSSIAELPYTTLVGLRNALVCFEKSKW